MGRTARGGWGSPALLCLLLGGAGLPLWVLCLALGCWGGAVRVPQKPSRVWIEPPRRGSPPRAPWGAPGPRSEDEDGVPQRCPSKADLPGRLVPLPPDRRVDVSRVLPGGQSSAGPHVAAGRGPRMGKLRHGALVGQGRAGRCHRAFSQLTRPACGPTKPLAKHRPELAHGGGAAACQPGLTHAEILLAWLKSPLPIGEGQTGDCPSFRSCPFSPSSAGLRPLGISKKPPEGSWVPACLCRGAPPPWGCPGGRQPATERLGSPPHTRGSPLKRGDPCQNGPWGPVPQPVFIQRCPLSCLEYPKEGVSAPKL